MYESGLCQAVKFNVCFGENAAAQDSAATLSLTDLSYGNGFWDAKRGDAVEDSSTDLDFSDLPIEVACRQALSEQFHTMHLGFDTASAVVSGEVSLQYVAQIL